MQKCVKNADLCRYIVHPYQQDQGGDWGTDLPKLLLGGRIWRHPQSLSWNLFYIFLGQFHLPQKISLPTKLGWDFLLIQPSTVFLDYLQPTILTTLSNVQTKQEDQKKKVITIKTSTKKVSSFLNGNPTKVKQMSKWHEDQGLPI